VTDEEFKTLYAEAFGLKKARKFGEAKECLARLVLERPDYAPVRGVLAGVLFELNEFAAAAAEFRGTTRLSPNSELASLGLFHSLLRIGDRASAIAEMKRFTSLRESAEYASLQSEFGAKLGEAE
jgi:predicted Zn-dependent protease